VIVNPTNVKLRHQLGASRIISEAAGPELNDECRMYIKKHRLLPPSFVMHTSAGNLNSSIKYVIHASVHFDHEANDSINCLQLLHETFMNCLNYANETLKMKSISMPAISSGLLPFAILKNELFLLFL